VVVTPVDSSVTGSDDPTPTDSSTTGTTLPQVPSTGDGGTSTSAVQQDDGSRIPELIALAVAGGLVGRHAVKKLRDRADRDNDGTAEMSPLS
jgi:hypothetical protein